MKMTRHNLSECTHAHVQILVAGLYQMRILDLGGTSDEKPLFKNPQDRWMGFEDNWITITWDGEVFLSKYLPKANAPSQKLVSLGVLMKPDASKSNKPYVWMARLGDCLLMHKARFNGVDRSKLQPVYEAAQTFLKAGFKGSYIASNRDGRTFLYQEVPGIKDGNWYTKSEAKLLGFTSIAAVVGCWYNACIAVEDIEGSKRIPGLYADIEPAVEPKIEQTVKSKGMDQHVIDETYVDIALVKRMESLIEGYEADIRGHKKEIDSRMESIKTCQGRIEALREVIAKTKAKSK